MVENANRALRLSLLKARIDAMIMVKDAKIITMTKSKNKIYIEPNVETMKEIAGCFTTLVKEYEDGVVFQFDNTNN